MRLVEVGRFESGARAMRALTRLERAFLIVAALAPATAFGGSLAPVRYPSAYLPPYFPREVPPTDPAWPRQLCRWERPTDRVSERWICRR